MQAIKKQKGMTMIGWLLVVMLVAVVALVAIKLIPVYLDGYKVYQSLESLKEDSSASGKSAGDLRKMVMKRLDINMVNDVKAENLTFTRKGNSTIVEVEYEARRQLFGNLYAVVVFNKTVEVER